MTHPRPSSHGSSQRRGTMRRRSHAAAQSMPFSAARIPDHPLIPAGAPLFIETNEALADLIGHVQQVGRFCFDTEFIGESFYHPHLCLLQIATPERVAVVDALAGVDVTPVWELLTEPSVQKIVHAGQQDLEPVVRHLGRSPANIFDTQVAAGFVGMPYPLSLSRLTQGLLNVRLGKRLTFTSWDHRPLSKAHLHYAADDVRYGPALRAALSARLEELGRADWAREQCERLCDPSMYQTDFAESAQKIRGAKALSRPQAAALYHLVVLRDELARLHNLPQRTMLRDEVLLDVARRSPQTLQELDQVRSLPRPVKADFGARILAAVEVGVAERRPPWPQVAEHEETPHEQFRIDTLWAVIQAHCRSLSVDPSLLGNRGDIADAYQAYVRGGEAPARIANGWRSQLLKGIYEEFLSGKQAITLHWQPDQNGDSESDI